MADAPVVHIGANSPEEVARKLMREIARVEQRSFNIAKMRPDWKAADRRWILNTYAECLEAVKGNRDYPRKPRPSRPQTDTWVEADQLPNNERG